MITVSYAVPICPFGKVAVVMAKGWPFGGSTTTAEDPCRVGSALLVAVTVTFVAVLTTGAV